MTCGAVHADSETPEAVKASPGSAWFEEVAEASGVLFEQDPGHRERHYLPETLGGGVGLLDFDGDGHLDIYFVQAGGIDVKPDGRPPNRLFRNRGGGTFEDVTDSAGVGDRGYGMGCVCADYDRDGDTDIYVTNVGGNVLYRNNGDGTFMVATTQAGINDPSWSTSAAFFDYDRDGHLDLFVTNYAGWSVASEKRCQIRGQPTYCSPTAYETPARDMLYRNRGNGTFKNVTRLVGLDKATGNGLGVITGDFNGDGYADICVVNRAGPNRLWINSGKGKFAEDARFQGCALNHAGVAMASAGVAAEDIENDGDLDLFVSRARGEPHGFFRNQSPWFVDQAASVGLGVATVAFTGFGMGLADFDHDGHLDLYVANGRVEHLEPRINDRDPFGEPNQLFAGRPDGTFREVEPRGGVIEAGAETSRGVACGDLDNDGDLDIVIANRGGKARVYRNLAGARGHWCAFDVRDTRDHVALGARLLIEVGGRKQWRRVGAASGYCSSHDARVYCGLGQAALVDRLTVHWVDGKTTELGPLDAGKLHRVSRGKP